MRTKPLGYATGAAVGTGGAAFALPTTTSATTVRVFVSELAYVGFGSSASPTAITANSPVSLQEANTTQEYTLNGHGSLDGSHVWVYGVAGAITDVRVSFLG